MDSGDVIYSRDEFDYPKQWFEAKLSAQPLFILLLLSNEQQVRCFEKHPLSCEVFVWTDYEGTTAKDVSGD